MQIEKKYRASVWIGLSLLGILMISGCISQEGNRIAVNKLAEKPQYYFEERVVLQGIIVPRQIEELKIGSYDEFTMTYFLYESPLRHTYVLLAYDDAGFIKRDPMKSVYHDQWVEILGEVRHDEALGFWIAFWRIKVAASPQTEPSATVTVTVTETVTEPNSVLYPVPSPINQTDSPP